MRLKVAITDEIAGACRGDRLYPPSSFCREMPVLRTSGLSDNMRMAVVPPLPLSQQILAWTLQALGYAEVGRGRMGVSPGTIKRARRGEPLPRSWEDLLAGAIPLFGGSPHPAALEQLAVGLRSWDERVGALPPAGDVPLEDRIHPVLSRAIPEVGCRLGALAALASVRTGTPITGWLWIADPLHPKFFGRIVQALLRYHRPEWKTVEAQKAGAAGVVDERTLERWFSGKIRLPNADQFNELGRLLGPGAEFVLRAGRLACVLRADLAGEGTKPAWISAVAAEDWARCVGQIGRETAQALVQPGVVADLIGLLRDELDGPNGDVSWKNLGAMVPEPVRGHGLPAFVNLLTAVQGQVRGGAVLANPVTLWILGVQTLLPHTNLVQAVGNRLGAHNLGVFTHLDLFQQVETDWSFGALARLLATRDTLTLSDATGNREDRPVPPEVREMATKWLARSREFGRRIDVPDRELQLRLPLLMWLTGEDAFRLLDDPRLQGGMAFLALADRGLEAVVTDEVASVSGPTCASRARRLAETGDLAGAARWAGRWRALPTLGSSREMDDITGAYVAMAHGVVDAFVEARRQLRRHYDDPAWHRLRSVILENIGVVEGLARTALTTGRAPERSLMEMTTLSAVVPLVVRVARLRTELGAEGGFDLENARSYVLRLERGLEQYPHHGPGWAALAVWHDSEQVSSHAAAHAAHYGSGALLADLRRRCAADFDLSDGAGSRPR